MGRRHESCGHVAELKLLARSMRICPVEGNEKQMDGRLTYREERPKGFDPVNGPVDLIFDALANVWCRVRLENALDVLTCLLEALSG
jgi:hypothetical protein